jgi:hypothetical protein
MTSKNPLLQSGIRLKKHGLLWFQQTYEAGETFASESRAASLIFARDLEKAGQKLATSWGRSAQGLQKALRREALDWQKLVLKTREGYVEAWQQRLHSLEAQAESAREALAPEAVEATVLESARDLLVKAQTTVDERIDKAQKPKKAAPKAKTPKPKAAATKKTVPIRNYDQLSAKDVVSRIQRLSGPQATAVLDYERARKKRATVIRAVERRLAAAG